MYLRYTEFGGAVPYRPVEDIAYSVARFILKGGSFVNYYMVKIYIQQSYLRFGLVWFRLSKPKYLRFGIYTVSWRDEL